MPAERRDAGGEVGDLAHRYRHAALVVGVEPHAAHARLVERGEFVVLDAQRDRHHRPRPVRRLRVERRHAVQDGGIVGAVDRGLREHHAVDAERGMQVLEVGQRRGGRVVAAAGRERVTRLEHVHVGVDRPAGQLHIGLAWVPDGRQAVSDAAGHGRSFNILVVERGSGFSLPQAVTAMPCTSIIISGCAKPWTVMAALAGKSLPNSSPRSSVMRVV